VLASPIQAWISNDILHIKGLTIGEPYQIYNVSGTLVYQSVAKTDVETFNLSALPRSVYIIVAGHASTLRQAQCIASLSNHASVKIVY
jgi:hypothetical protein